MDVSILPDDTEQVDVGVVDCEVHEHRSSGTVQPQVLLQLLDDLQGL